MSPTTALSTPVTDWLLSHKAAIGAFVFAGLMAVVPDSWKPVVSAIGMMLAGHAGSSVGTAHAVEAHLRKRGI